MPKTLATKSVTTSSKLGGRGAWWTAVRRNPWLSVSYPAFLLTYSLFILLPKPKPQTLQQYHLSVLGVRLIDLTIIILIAVIWATGFYAYAKLHAYVKLVRRQKDGAKIEVISRGILLLVMWLPVSEVVSAILGYLGLHHLSWLPTITIINNYLNLVLPLAAFIFIGWGARGLSGLVRSKHTYYITNLMTLATVFVGVTYTNLVAATANRTAVYHLSLWLILLTIVAPYIYMWFIGIMATYEIYNYQHKVGGLLYRRSWSLLALGCGWLVVTSIIFQFLTTLSMRLASLSIYWLLSIIYLLLAILSVGFILIAIGAARLQKIEEV